MNRLSDSIPAYLYAPAVCLLWILALWLVKRIVFRHLKRWTAASSRRWDDIIVRALSFPVTFLIFASAIAALANYLPLSDKIKKLANMGLQGSIIFSAAFFLDALLKAVVDEYSSRSVFSKVSHGLAKGIVRGLIIGIAALIFLDLLGISITPILASLGIGSLAVALALQDTLSNFFAGIYVSIDRPVDLGDFVRLETGQEGYVTDIGWRSTKIRTPANNVVIVPNAKIIGSIVTNFSLPEKEVVVTTEVAVSYDSDLKKVENVTRAAAKEVLKTVKGGVPEFEPAVVFHTFADSGINFTVVMRAKEFSDTGPLKHELIKALHERYAAEGISMPFPSRTLGLSQETVRDLKTIFKN